MDVQLMVDINTEVIHRRRPLDAVVFNLGHREYVVDLWENITAVVLWG